jgi:hypothetical protein
LIAFTRHLYKASTKEWVHRHAALEHAAPQHTQHMLHPSTHPYGRPVLPQGFQPLSYQWFKDDKALHVATSDTAHLFLAECSHLDVGLYHCQV